ERCWVLYVTLLQRSQRRYRGVIFRQLVSNTTQQSSRPKLDRRLVHVNYSLAATQAIPPNSHQGRASAFQWRYCPPASGESPLVATAPAYGHVPCPPTSWRS